METQPFCYKCGTPCQPGEAFCKKCGMPISFQATAGPYETVLARGFMLREATTQPRKPIVVIGILLLFVPQIVFAVGFGCFAVYDSIARIGRGDWDIIPNNVLGLLLIGGYVYICWRIISKTVRSYIRTREDATEIDDFEGRES